MRRIIVVDDEAPLRGALRSVLEGHGYEVLEADDGKTALQLSELAGADLVITDIVMPEIEGTALIMQLRRDHPAVKILALSGSPLAMPGKYLQVAGKLGAAATLPKPFKTQDLLRIVRELVGE